MCCGGATRVRPSCCWRPERRHDHVQLLHTSPRPCRTTLRDGAGLAAARAGVNARGRNGPRRSYVRVITRRALGPALLAASAESTLHAVRLHAAEQRGVQGGDGPPPSRCRRRSGRKRAQYSSKPRHRRVWRVPRPQALITATPQGDRNEIGWARDHALFAACEHGHLDTVHLLLSRGASPNPRARLDRAACGGAGQRATRAVAAPVRRQRQRCQGGRYALTPDAVGAREAAWQSRPPARTRSLAPPRASHACHLSRHRASHATAPLTPPRLSRHRGRHHAAELGRVDRTRGLRRLLHAGAHDWPEPARTPRAVKSALEAAGSRDDPAHRACASSRAASALERRRRGAGRTRSGAERSRCGGRTCPRAARGTRRRCSRCARRRRRCSRRQRRRPRGRWRGSSGWRRARPSPR